MNLLEKIIIYIYAFFLTLFPVPTYTEGTTGQPQSFLPTQAVTQQDKTISSLLFRGLFKYDIYGTLIPDLAETWAVSEDGMVYTVKLKAGQKWTNGKIISSDDVIYTAFKTTDLQYVATDKVDDLTVRFVLPNRYSPFLNLLTVGIEPSGSEEKADPTFPVSSGDFRVGRIERDGPWLRQVTLLSSNKNHRIKKLSFRFYPNEAEVITAAKLGEIEGFMSENKVELENFDDFKFPLQGIYYALFFNTRREVVAEERTRQKLQKVLDVNHLVEPYGILAQGPVSRSAFTNRALVFDNYDELFKEDLGGDVSFNLVYPNTDTHENLAKTVAQIWESKLGVNVVLVAVPPEEMVSRIIERRNFDVLLFGQEVGRDPDRYVLWHSAQKDVPGLNISGFDQVRADRALEEGRKELDNEKRVIHYNEFQKVVIEKVPAVFLYHPFKDYYVSKYVTGIGEKYTFSYTDRFLDFFNWDKVRTN